MAMVLVAALGVGFFLVRFQKSEADIQLASLTSETAAEAPTVNVIAAEPTDASQSLTLPGETAAWDQTTIYARVNGYVATWLVDIGDHVKAGQSLAAIETPELDAELNAAKAKLNAAVAEVAVKQAQADFAETTERRWRESPKGVVSDQEREAKIRRQGGSDRQSERVASAGRAAASRGRSALRADPVQGRQGAVRGDDRPPQYRQRRSRDRREHREHLLAVPALEATIRSEFSSMCRRAPPRKSSPTARTWRSRTMTIPRLRLEGQVTRTAKEIDPASRTMRIEVDLPNADRALVPGMYVQATFKFKGTPLSRFAASALLFRSDRPASGGYRRRRHGWRSGTSRSPATMATSSPST